MNKTKITYRDRCTGVLLGTAVGDILGAAVEGYNRAAILDIYGEVIDFLPSSRGQGCYTDDTEMTLALADSIIANKGVDAHFCAQNYAHFYHSHRGYGSAAHVVMSKLKEGSDYRETGTIIFKDGSYGNGGAMRIAPVGLVYANCDDEGLKKAVTDAVRCTHVHPEGVDGALVQAKAVALLSRLDSPAELDRNAFLKELYRFANSHMMKTKLSYLDEELKNDTPDARVVSHIGNGIRAVEAAPCALLAAIRYIDSPETAVIKAVNFGGDTDTIGAMTGALMGALHGKDWIPARWLDNMENDEKGRDYIIGLAKKLSELEI